MPVSAGRYLSATMHTLEAGIENSYKDIDLSDEQIETLENALEVVDEIEEACFPVRPPDDGDDDHEDERQGWN